MIKIKYGKTYGDATSEYIIETSCKTVREFIDEYLATHPKEWGSFGIKSQENPFFGNPKTEFKYGRIIDEGLPEWALNSPIKSVVGSGGWSLSSFIFEIEKSEYEPLNELVDDETPQEKAERLNKLYSLESIYKEIHNIQELLHILLVDIGDTKVYAKSINERILPKKTAHWETICSITSWQFTRDHYKCSECGTHWEYQFNYCPNCGAKMEAADESNN